MTRGRFLLSQISLFAIVGTAAALIVWAIMIWPVHDIWHPDDLDVVGQPSGFSTDPGDVWTAKFITVLLLYLPLGLALGISVTMVQPVWDSSLRQAIKNEWRWLLLGSALGGVGAILGGLGGEYVLNKLTDPTSGRVVGSLIMGMVMGVVLGLVERWRTGSQERLVAGVVGGVLGGGIAGVIFQFGAYANSAIASAVSIMSFAALVLGAIGAVAFLKTRAKLAGTPKNSRKYDKWERDLLNDVKNIVGSALTGSQKASIKLYDQSILPEHAVIYYDAGAGEWRLQRYNANVRDLFVNGERLADEVRALRSGDIVGIGKNLEFRFEVER